MVMPVLKALKTKISDCRGNVAIAFSANIGGMATPVGTPPNAIAIGMLADKGVSISFYEWMKIAFPITAIMLLVTFAVLLLLFRFKIHNIEESPKLNISCIKFGLNEKIVVSITLLTIVLWFISEFIGLNAGIIALIPLICFYGTNILDKDDFRTLDWDVLMLMGGGMALSEAMKISGLAEWMVTTSGVAHFNDTYILLGFMILTFVLTNFMSNTTTAALMLPLALSVIKDPLIAGYTVALTASMSMLLPISTPPNAIAYNSGFFSVKTMLFAGTIIGMIGMAIIFNYLLMM
ncbi:MAG: anion permease [bacterium]|nr:anion permease [bacterium]